MQEKKKLYGEFAQPFFCLICELIQWFVKEELGRNWNQYIDLSAIIISTLSPPAA